MQPPGSLKNSTYLEVKNGQRVFLEHYVPPHQNVLGAALFVFPRRTENRLTVSADDLSVRFHSEYESKTAVDSSTNASGQVNNPRQNPTSSLSRVANQNPFRIKLDMKFKIHEMRYNGVLEY